MRVLVSLIAFGILPCAGISQTAATKPVFDLAAVYPGTVERYPAMRVGIRAGRLEITSATMVDLISNAYGVQADQVAGGPAWLESDRFDVIARLPANASQQGARQMLQSLLTERFGLAVHNDQRPRPAYVLSAGSGEAKMKPADAPSSNPCQRQSPADANAPIPAVCHGIAMAEFARLLQSAAGDYLGSPVVDETHMDGAWDFSIQWTPKNRLAAAGDAGITIFNALDKQLGLKLQLKQVPSPVIVVDSVSRKPTPNLPEAASALRPAPPPQFEAATIKPTDPQVQDMKFQILPSGQVNLQGMTMGFLIQTIWFMSPEMIVGAPKWMDTRRWDIVGKVAVTPGAPPQTDLDSMMAMVRALIEDRFKMKTHTEERTVSAETLTAIKPRLQKADPANRTGCKEGPGADGKDPRVTNPALSRLVTCQNMTMAEFAERLPGIANRLNQLNGPIRSTVLDSTGLSGAWDFAVTFSPELGVSPGGVPAQVSGAAPDPDGKVSLAEALARQLGLGLGKVKRPATVLVIDHMEQSPVEN